MKTFERIVCGLDGTPEADAALGQSIRLAADGATLVLVHAFKLTTVNEVELMLGETWQKEERRASEMLEQARAWAIEFGGLEPKQVEMRVVPGPKAKGLLEVVAAASATLLSVGVHGRSRLVGALRGSVASQALHSAPCSVLVAREPETAVGAFPVHVVCGVDGSTDSQHAVDTAHELCSRVDCSARYVCAEDGLGVVFSDAAKQTPTAGDLEIEPGKPVDVLLKASADADLLVLGSRGLSGTHAIGSVSERVAHDAACSVLVTRA